MYKWNEIPRALAALGLGLGLSAQLLAASLPPAPGLGRSATAAEIAAWDIDVRADFTGLPKGHGSVMQGQQIWDTKCAACHGAFGESNQVFPPIVGGTTAADITSGRVAALRNNREPQRSTLMKLSSLSTLWDYIRRAMPWNAPKTLSVDEVYAVTAYILHLGDILPADASLDQDSIRRVQLPNRNGMTQQHGLWRTDGKPDVHNRACMQNCVEKVNLTSRLPAYAANSHGDLAAQQRLIGLRPLAAAGVESGTPAAGSDKAGKGDKADTAALLQKHQCASCHTLEDELIGPPWRAVASNWKGKPDAAAQLQKKIRQGGSGNWGDVPMPPQSAPSDAELQQISRWILDGAP